MAKTGAAVIDPYELLGVARDADEAAIKAAYRKVAKTAHPDAGGDAEAFAKSPPATSCSRIPCAAGCSTTPAMIRSSPSLPTSRG